MASHLYFDRDDNNGTFLPAIQQRTRANVSTMSRNGKAGLPFVPRRNRQRYPSAVSNSTESTVEDVLDYDPSVRYLANFQDSQRQHVKHSPSVTLIKVQREESPQPIIVEAAESNDEDSSADDATIRQKSQSPSGELSDTAYTNDAGRVEHNFLFDVSQKQHEAYGNYENVRFNEHQLRRHYNLLADRYLVTNNMYPSYHHAPSKASSVITSVSNMNRHPPKSREGSLFSRFTGFVKSAVSGISDTSSRASVAGYPTHPTDPIHRRSRSYGQVLPTQRQNSRVVRQHSDARYSGRPDSASLPRYVVVPATQLKANGTNPAINQLRANQLRDAARSASLPPRTKYNSTDSMKIPSDKPTPSPKPANVPARPSSVAVGTATDEEMGDSIQLTRARLRPRLQHTSSTTSIASSAASGEAQGYENLKRMQIGTLSSIVRDFPRTYQRLRTQVQGDADSISWSSLHVVVARPQLTTEFALFYAAVLELPKGASPVKVTLMISPAQYGGETSSQRFSFDPPILLTLTERIPTEYLLGSGSEGAEEENNAADRGTSLCTIAILPRMQLWPLDVWAATTLQRHQPMVQPRMHEKDVCFLALQLLTALKQVQSKGVEELGNGLDAILITKPPADHRHAQLLLFADALEENTDSPARMSLSQVAIYVLFMVLHVDVTVEEVLNLRGRADCEALVELIPQLTEYSSAFRQIILILSEEKAQSLSDAKACFEYLLYVPQHKLRLNDQFDHSVLRLWLEDERAAKISAFVNSVLRSPATTIALFDEYYIQFLLHASTNRIYTAHQCLSTAINKHSTEI